MRRVAPAIPIPPKVFKHFAALTMAITVCMALFIDGEGSEVIAAQVKARQTKNALLNAEVSKTGARHFRKADLVLHKDKRSHMPFAPDAPNESAAFGAPMTSPAGESPGGSGGTTGPAAVPFSALSGPGAALLGNPVGPGVLVGSGGVQGRPGGQPQPRPNQQQLNKLLDASRMRSGW